MLKERVVVDEVSEYLNGKSFRVVTELPFLQRHVDIVGYHSGADILIAVEAKVKNWQIALRQAVSCLLFADEVYIAMPAEYIHRVNQAEIAKFGIGLLEVNGLVNIVSQAVSSQYSSDHHRKQVVDRFHWLESVREKGQNNASG